MPAIIATFDDMQQPRSLVGGIVVIVGGDEIAQVVENEFLWIAHAESEDLHF